MTCLTNTVNRETQPYLIECALNFLSFEEYTEMFNTFCGIDEGLVSETYYLSLFVGDHPNDIPF